jgi:hypothetical protein
LNPLDNQYLLNIPNNDNGDIYTGVTSGAICPIVYNEETENLWESEVVWGARVDNRDGTAVYSLNMFCPSYNVGSYELQRVYSPNIRQSWNDYHSFIDKFTVSGEEVVMKYRVDSKEETKVMSGVWSDTNIINSTNTSLETDPWEDIVDGNEVVVLDEYGRGYSAHVTNVDFSGNTKIITLDENIGTLNKNVTFYATNYKTEKTYSPDEEDINSSADMSGGWLQVKAELRGFEIAVAINDLSNTKDE